MNTRNQVLIEKNKDKPATAVRLNIREAGATNVAHLTQILQETQELLKEVKTNFAEDIIAERKM